MAEFLTIIHACEDFKTWKIAYDADASNRRAAGLTDLIVVQASEEPNLVALLFGVGNLSTAKDMVASEQLRATMQRAGVVGAPNIRFREGAYRHETAATYLTINCRISGIDKFKTGYAMDKADREAATLTDLGLLQNIDDRDDLLLMWAVRDAAKVRTLLALPALAKHQVETCGVVSEPVVRFWAN